MFWEFMMNKLTYMKDGIISSLEDIDVLAKKQNGRILVFSDTHSVNPDLLREVVENFAQDVDVMLFCGDGISDLEELIQESMNNEKLKEQLPELIAFVRGNNDPKNYVLSMPNSEGEEEDFKLVQIDIPESTTFLLAGRRIFATHGHRHSVNYTMDLLYAIAENLPADMMFYGHTHKAYWEETQGTLFLNPGSLCLPRGGQEPSFAVVSFPGITERYTVEYFTMDKNILGSYVFSKI